MGCRKVKRKGKWKRWRGRDRTERTKAQRRPKAEAGETARGWTGDGKGFGAERCKGETRRESEQRGLQREDYTKPGLPALNAWLGLGGVVGTARAPGTGGVQEARTDTWGLTHQNGALWAVGGRWSPCPATTAGAGRCGRSEMTLLCNCVFCTEYECRRNTAVCQSVRRLRRLRLALQVLPASSRVQIATERRRRAGRAVMALESRSRHALKMQGSPVQAPRPCSVQARGRGESAAGALGPGLKMEQTGQNVPCTSALRNVSSNARSKTGRTCRYSDLAAGD